MTAGPDRIIPSGTRAARVALVLGVLALALTTVRQAAAHGLLASAPATALEIAPENAAALGASIDTLFATNLTPRRITQIAALSRKALLRSPLETKAIRSLGIAAGLSDDTAHERAYMAIAARTSKRDSATMVWKLDDGIRNRRYADAVDAADALLRTRQSMWPRVLPQLVGLIDQPGAIDPLARAMARPTFWRPSFLVAAGTYYRGRDPAFRLFQHMQAMGSPPTSAELAPYFAEADTSQDPAAMLRRWRSLAPAGEAATAGQLRDGDFDGLDAPPPFNWAFRPQGYAAAVIAPAPDGQGRALEVNFDGSEEAQVAHQALVLPPGRYILRTRTIADRPIEGGALAWVIDCATPRQRIAEIAVEARADGWSETGFAFTVPQGCGAQILRLRTGQTELTGSRSLWIDRVSLAASQ